MREIKFRVWCKNNNEWEKNKVLVGLNGALLHDVFGLFMPMKKENHVLMQYTGLKDKNGKEIYEGDIISDGSLVSDSGNIHKADVFFENGSFKLKKINCTCGECDTLLLCDELYNLEIIGNIYENPELLKDKK